MEKETWKNAFELLNDLCEKGYKYFNDTDWNNYRTLESVCFTNNDPNQKVRLNKQDELEFKDKSVVKRAFKAEEKMASRNNIFVTKK